MDQQKDKGFLVPGKLADMTLLSGNPGKDIYLQNIKVTGTIVRGIHIT